jgi:hypothetical protein
MKRYKCLFLHLLISREEHKRIVFRNGLLKRISGTETHEETGWTKLHKERFTDYTPHQIYCVTRVIKWRGMRWAVRIARMRR